MVELEMFAEGLEGPLCRECGAITRVVGIEHHPIVSQVTVVTLECVKCSLTTATIAMPTPVYCCDHHAR